MLKRLISFGLVLILTAGLFVGCGKETAPIGFDSNDEIDVAAKEISDKYADYDLPEINGGKDVTIKVFLNSINPTISTEPTPEQPDVFNSTEILRRAFQFIYPNVKIEWVRTVDASSGESLLQYLTTQINSNTAPDLMYASGASFSDRGWFYDYNEVLDEPNPFVEGNKKWRDQIPEYLFNHWSVSDVNNRVLGMPLSCSPGTATGLYYNKNIFDELKIELPKTWEQLFTVTDALKKAGYVAFVPWGGPGSGNRKPSTLVWDVQMSLGPFFAAAQKEKIDYDHDGYQSQEEKLRAAYEGYFFVENNPYAQELWYQVKRKYNNCMEAGYQNTDYESKWLLGNVGILEDGLWRYPSEMSNTERTFDFGVVPPPAVDNDTTDLVGKLEYTEVGPSNPPPYETYNILLPSVESHGGNGVLEACIAFMQFLMVPDNNNMIVLEQKGKTIGFLEGSIIPQELQSYLNQQFPKIPSFEWPGGFTSSGCEKLGIVFEMWVNDQISTEKFYNDFDEEFKKDIDDYINDMQIDVSGWKKGW